MYSNRHLGNIESPLKRGTHLDAEVLVEKKK